ncbi:MAG: sulfatase-like hydrolase/transferase [Opitutales bacterium]|nr:sulfatase-like hydrolase/transferase [Opitutales bacterium]
MQKPNVIMIMADDVGYGDLSVYGQQFFKTPHLDNLAASGARFTQFYTGAPVCSPARSSYMQGVDTGHSRVRGNANFFYNRTNLRPSDVTIGEVLQQAGYHTAHIGKWHLSIPGATGQPQMQGFDYWFGPLNKDREESGPNPYFLNGEEIELEVGSWGHDHYMRHALKYIRERALKNQPFFLNLALKTAHASHMKLIGTDRLIDIDPEFDKFDWNPSDKRVATMIRAMDDGVGAIVSLLNELGIQEKTVVFFTSDNGPHAERGSNPETFDRNGAWRGIKRDMYEGGIRVPMIVSWPGTIEAGQVTDHPSAFLDLMSTYADMADAVLPSTAGGISILPGLLGKQQPQHPYLYWEFSFRKSAFKQAIRIGPWKGIRIGHYHPLELYNINEDPGEMNDLALKYPRYVTMMENWMNLAREDNPEFYPGVEMDIPGAEFAPTE